MPGGKREWAAAAMEGTDLESVVVMPHKSAMFSPRLKSAAYVAATFVLLTGAPLRGQTVEILGKSATFKLTSDLQIIASTDKAVAVRVKGAPLSGNLNLSAGTGRSLKEDFPLILQGQKAPFVTILTTSQRGNTFAIELQTGKSNHDLRALLYGVYVPQAPGARQKVFLGKVSVSNANWNSPGAKSLRAALQSLKPKDAKFKDTKAPSLVIADPPRQVVSFDDSYAIKGFAWDNVTPVLLQVRVRAPGASSYSAWIDTTMRGTASQKQWTYRLPMQTAKGVWQVQVRVADAAGNVTAPASASVRRL
jgi:hypothetical protein